MSVTITVRNVPETVRDELAARAARSGTSLQAYLLDELTEFASHEDVRTVIGRARERVARTGTRLPVDAILAHRDEDRR